MPRASLKTFLTILAFDVVPGGWSDWIPTENCKDLGNMVWEKLEMRNCDSPEPFNGGMQCQGNDSRIEICPPGIARSF